MSGPRRVDRITNSVPTVEGAGVHLKRAFGNKEAPMYDPFLLLDDFHSQNPTDYKAGFPWHPHRGIETVTYMIEGRVDHGDSLKNKGTIGPGDVQWMTAGSGIIHQEMPKGHNGSLWGLQLWVNLPAAEKMTKPKYRGIKSSEVPEKEISKGVKAKVICGILGDAVGPVSGISVDPLYADISVEKGASASLKLDEGKSAFVYVLDGEGQFGSPKRQARPEDLLLLSDGSSLEVAAGAKKLRFILVSGKPLKEPIAWYGPIVMNTNKELEQAFDEYRRGTFLKD